jgi:ABC-2 type transport system permease protein
MEIIYIMWRRQLKLYWRSKPRVLGSIAQPLLFLVALGFGFGPVFERAGGLDYIQFLTPGIVAMTILFGSMFSGMSLIWDRQFGFLKESLVAPVSRIKLLIGRTLGGTTIAVLQGTLVLIISIFLGFRIENGIILFPAVLFMFLISMFFTLLGTTIATQLEDMEAFPLIMNFLIMPIFFLSGALFPLKGLPASINFIAQINPLSYGVDGLRIMLGGEGQFRLGFDFSIFFIITAVLLMIGSKLFERIQV